MLNGQRTISGLVQSSADLERLPFADVVIKGTTTGTSTNVDGYFTLVNVSEDSLTLIIQYIGHASKSLQIDAGNEDVEQLKVLLESGITLDEVLVTGSSFKLMKASDGLSVVQVSPSQLSLLPNIGEVDIFRSLQLLPGVSGSNESSSGLFVRGGTPDQNLVLLDGMTVYNVDHFFGFFSAFNADAIKDVQLFKGAFPAKYGGRLSSVVDLTGKTGNTSEVHGNLGLNLLNARASIQIPLFNKGSLSISGRRSYTDIIRSGLYNNILGVFEQTQDQPPANIEGLDITTIEPDFHFFDFNSKLSITPSDKDVLAVSFYNGADHLIEANDLTLERPLPMNTLFIRRDLDETSDWGNKGVSAKWSRQWNPNWYSNVLVAYSNYFSDFSRNVFLDVSIPERDTTVFSQNFTGIENNDVTDLTFKIDNEVLVNSQHKLEFGLSATKAEVDYTFVRNDTFTILDLRQDANYYAAYISDKWKPFQGLTINAGLRTTYFDATDEIYWAPRFSFQYSMNDRIKVKGGYGKHFQFVNRIVNENVTEGSRDFWLLSDNDITNTSNATHYIAGASFETDDFIFDVEAYHKDLDNLAEFSLRFQRNDIDINRLFFSGQGYAQGIEFLVQKKRGAHTGWISYTLSRVRNTFPDINSGFEFPALHDQRHEFKTVHSYEIENWKFSGTFVYATGKPFTEPAGQYSLELLDGTVSSYVNVGPKNGSRLPPYHRLDIAAYYILKKGKVEYDFGLSVFNLYGRRNIWYREYDFSQFPPIITDIRYLGMTPNISVDLRF